MALGRRDGKEYAAGDLSLLTSIASQTAPAVDNAILYEDLERLVRQRTEELSHAKDQAEDANRQKSRFLATMSHELRTPLNALLGFAQILRREGNLDERQDRALEIMQRSGEQLLTLIEDLLDLSKIEAGRLEVDDGDFALGELLTHLSEIFQLRATERGVEFACEVACELPAVVRGDQRKLRQVLMNLLGNAMKYTDTGRVTLRVVLREERVRFEVIDTGLGVSDADQSTIFEAFQQVQRRDRVNQGTGLGLAISKHLVSLMGGELQLASEPGRGSSFSFELTLPALAESTVAQVPSHDVIGFEGRPMRVLVVDDDSTNRAFVAQLLVPLGFEVLEAADGRSAITLATAQLPDLVLMDVVMPQMSGYEAIAEMRKHASLVGTPVIVLSASVFPIDRDQARKSGGDDFVAKPIRTEELLDRIAHHLEIRWLRRPDAAATNASRDDVGRPPPELLRPLFEAARRGRVAAVRRALDAIEASDARFASFVSPLRNWAKNFELERIATQLEALVS
jgi:signal transduction histidine kinase/CheY-like chemotaxis protein